jgi:hypothetical protein
MGAKGQADVSQASAIDMPRVKRGIGIKWLSLTAPLAAGSIHGTTRPCFGRQMMALPVVLPQYYPPIEYDGLFPINP